MATSVRSLTAIVAAVGLTLTAPAALAQPGVPSATSDGAQSVQSAQLVPLSTAGPAPLDNIAIDLEEVASGFNQPLFLTARPGDDRRYIVEKGGTIRSIDPAGGNRTLVLDVSSIASTANEQGLLGIAFHPEQPERLFISYTDNDGDSVIAEYDFPLNATTVSTPETAVLLEVDQDGSNHNGGMIAFGPDGYLYAGFGDGGGQGDPFNHGQNPDTIPGSMARLDVDGAPSYIPASNPFADGAGGDPAVWAYGLRNPWRFSFDGNDLYIADVGESRMEEINKVNVPTSAGANFGWSDMEGVLCHPSGDPCDGDDFGFVDPIFTYGIQGQDECSITGGYVYRGSAYPILQGAYVFSDFCTGEIQALRTDGDTVTEHRTYSTSGGRVTSFGTDNDGRLYVADFGAGRILEVTATRTSFPDVPPGHPFYDEIEWLIERGITTGYDDGTYRPQTRVSRQAIAAFLSRYLGTDGFEAPSSPTFTDVPTDHPFYAEIEWLADSGITTGYDDGTFQPGKRVSRQAVSAFFYRMADEPDFDAPSSATFPDVSTGHTFYAEIEWLASTDITTGYEDGMFQPTRGLSRQAIAAFFYRYDQLD